MRQADPDNPLYRDFLALPETAPALTKWHHYFDVYQDALRPFIGQPVTLLEIGVAGGGSLAMWRRLLGPGARIAGIDIDPAVRATAPADCPVFIGDQGDAAFLRGVLAEIGAPTIVIDDGGHTNRQQIVSFETIYPIMPSPGVYIIEDTHTAFWPAPRFAAKHEGRGIYDLAFEVCRRLQDWTGQRDQFRRYARDPAQRAEPGPEVSALCRTTRSVAFHDSMIVFRREDRPEPWVQRRGRRG